MISSVTFFLVARSVLFTLYPLLHNLYDYTDGATGTNGTEK